MTPHLSVKSNRMGPHSSGKCLYCAWGKVVIVPVFQIDQWPVRYSSDSSAEGECTVGPGKLAKQTVLISEACCPDWQHVYNMCIDFQT